MKADMKTAYSSVGVHCTDLSPATANKHGNTQWLDVGGDVALFFTTREAMAQWLREALAKVEAL